MLNFNPVFYTIQIKFFLIAILSFALVCSINSAFAQSTAEFSSNTSTNASSDTNSSINLSFEQPISIGFIDIAEVQRQSLAWQNARAQLELLRTKYKSEISAIEERLEKDSNDLKLNRSLIDEEQFKAKQEEFRKQVEELKNMAHTLKQNLDTVFTQVQQQLRRALILVIDELTERYNIDAVINVSKNKSNQVIMFNPSFSLDAVALKRLNETTPSIDFAKLEQALPSYKNKLSNILR